MKKIRTAEFREYWKKEKKKYKAKYGKPTVFTREYYQAEYMKKELRKQIREYKAYGITNKNVGKLEKELNKADPWRRGYKSNGRSGAEKIEELYESEMTSHNKAVLERLKSQPELAQDTNARTFLGSEKFHNLMRYLGRMGYSYDTNSQQPHGTRGDPRVYEDTELIRANLPAAIHQVGTGDMQALADKVSELIEGDIESALSNDGSDILYD